MKVPSSTPEQASGRKSSQSLLLQHAFSQFISLSEIKIEHILSSTGPESDLYKELLQTLDEDFVANTALLGSMAKYDLKCIIDSLMAWRKSKSELQEKNARFESKLLLFNYILVMILKNILKNLTSETLPEQLGVKIEEMVFGQLNNTDPEMIQRKINRYSNMESFASLAGVLSELRFPTVSSRFLLEINKSSSVKESKGELLIRCMRYLNLKIYPLEKLEETVHFLKVCGESFLESHSLKLKHAFAMTFLDLLEPIAAVASAEVNLPTWMKTIDLIFPKAQKMIGKPRHFQTAMPLITTLLCVSKRDFFLKNWLAFCDTFVQKFKDRDKLTRHSALASVIRLIWVYLFRCVDSVTTNAVKKMDSLLRSMFPVGRRTIYPNDLDLELHIRLVYYISNRFPDFSAECVFPLLLGYSTHHQPLVSASAVSPDDSNHIFGTGSPIYPVPGILQSSASSLSLISNSSVNDSPPLERYAIGIGSFHNFIIDVLVSLAPVVSSAPSIPNSPLSINTSAVLVESKYTLATPAFPRFTDTSKFGFCDIQIPDLATSLPPIITSQFWQKLNVNTRDTLEKVNEVMGVLGGILEAYFRKIPILDLICDSCNPTLNSPYMMGNYGAGTINSIASITSNRSSLAEQSLSSLSLIDFRSSNAGDRNYMLDVWKIWIDAMPILSPQSMSPKAIISFVTLALFSGYSSLHDASLRCLERISGIESNDYCGFWISEGLSWREHVIESVLDSAYRCLIENMADVLGIQWKKFELSIIHSVHRLLDLWLVEVPPNNGSNIQNMIDQLEGCSLIFLCSINHEVRSSAVDILRKIGPLIPSTNLPSSEELEKDEKVLFNRNLPSLKRPLKEYSGLVPHNTRILVILRQIGRDLVRRHFMEPSTVNRPNFSGNEEELKEKEYRKRLFVDPDSLLNIAGSSSSKDNRIWSRCFPDLSGAFFDYGFVQPLAIAFRQLMNGIHILSPTILQSSESGPKVSTGTIKWASEKSEKKLTMVSDELIEQWSFYCVFAVSVSAVVTTKDLQLLIRGSIPSELAVETLFNSLLDFMGVERAVIRQVAVKALCSMRSDNYKLFFDLLEPHIIACTAMIKHGNLQNSRKMTNNILAASQKKFERQRQDLVYILSFIADFVDVNELRNSEFMPKFLSFVKHMARFLSIPDVQNEWEHQLLRSYFCGMVGRFYSHLVRAKYHTEGRKSFEDSFPFDLRLGLFRLFETWCGYGELSKQTRDREANLMNQVLDQVKDINERASLTMLMEDQRMMLEVSSLKAMCALSFGPLSHSTIPKNRFELQNLIVWIKSIFQGPDAKIHPIAHLALEYMLSSNPKDVELWDLVVDECYCDRESITSIRIFLVLADVLCQNTPNPCSLSQICTLTLYQIGNPDLSVRNAAAHLFSHLDQHFDGNTVSEKAFYDIPNILDDFASPLPEIEDSMIRVVGDGVGFDLNPDSHLISRPIAVVFKSAQRGISAKWANQRKDLSFSIIYEIFKRIDTVDKSFRPNDVNDLLKVLVPWISNVDLKICEYNFSQKKGIDFDSLKPPSSSDANLCLTILFCLTIKYSYDFLVELEAIWLSLFESQDEYILRTSMEIVAEYLIQIALIKKNPKAIHNGKTIFIYLAQLNSFEILLERINPENMIPYTTDKNAADIALISNLKMIDSVLLDTATNQSFSRSQIAIMFVSDMILQISPSEIISHLSIILHVCLVHIDHFSALLAEDCIALLNGTIHALVLDLSEPIIPSNARNLIKYEDLSPPCFKELESVKRIKSIILKLISVFSGLKPGFRNEWADISFKWGIGCPIHHIASRSFQIYRCLSSEINKSDPGKLIVRISTILGDEVAEVQGYAMECLETLIYMVNSADSIEDYSGVWWAGVACLYSPHIWEYGQGIEILYVFTRRLSFESQSVLDTLDYSKPKSNENSPIFEKMLRGLYHDSLAYKTLEVFNMLAPLPKSVSFLGDASHRLLCGILANVTHMIKSFDFPSECKSVYQVAAKFCELSASLGYDQLSDLLSSFSQHKFRKKDDFIFQLWSIIYDIFPSFIKFIVSVILRLTQRKDSMEITLQVLYGLVRVLGPLQFSSLSKSANFWSPLIELIKTNASSTGLVAVLDLALSKSNPSETDLKLLFGKSKIANSQTSNVDPRQVRRNFQNLSRNMSLHANSTSHRKERLKKELEQVSMALEEELDFDHGP